MVIKRIPTVRQQLLAHVLLNHLDIVRGSTEQSVSRHTQDQLQRAHCFAHEHYQCNHWHEGGHRSGKEYPPNWLTGGGIHFHELKPREGSLVDKDDVVREMLFRGEAWVLIEDGEERIISAQEARELTGEGAGPGGDS